MGAWGDGPFDNDDASDWAFEFDGVDVTTGLNLLAEALDVGNDGDYLDAPEGSIAVAAAAVVGWLHDRATIPSSPYSQAVAAWVRATSQSPDASLTAAARAALDRVRSDQSELAELWAESGDAAWRESLAQIQTRLESPA